jgi:DNA-directed RNA polymerase specialized sigma24 family protein
LSENIATIRSRDEIESAIHAFTEADKARLRITAWRYASIYSIDAEDLLQATFVRALDTRNCPAHVDVVKFLTEAMRSIAHGEYEKAKSRPVAFSVISSGDNEGEAFDYPDPSPSVEEKMIEKESAANLRHSILSLFDDDPQARDIIEGKIAGWKAEELREFTGLDETAYDSKIRLIRRRINKHIPRDGSHERK